MRLFMLLALLASLLPMLSAATGPMLDGRTFTIDLVEDESGKAQGKDALVFAKGFGECQVAGKKYGYAKGLCTVAENKKTRGVVAFRFTMSSAEHGDLLFEGTIRGKAVEGRRTWSKPGKTPIVHRFTGTQP